MGEAPAKEVSRPGRRGFGGLRKIDDLVFAVEKSVVSFALVTITVIVFVDVIARRITAPDSKVGQLISRIARIDDLETRGWIDTNVAPWVTFVLAFSLIAFAAYSSRRFARARAGDTREVDARREVGLAAGIAVLGLALGYGFSFVFAALESWMVYAGTFSISSLAYVAFHVRRRREHWPVRVAAGLLTGALLVWLCLPMHGEDSLSYVPEGYTWSKKISLALLLWVGLLSASICVYAGKHIRMGAAQKLAPVGARRYLNGSGFLAAAIFCALMTYLGFDYVFAPKASTDPFMTEILTLGGTRYVFGFEGMVGRGGFLEGTEIPDWFGILAAPIGFGIATLRFLAAGASSFLGGHYGADAAEEGVEEARRLAREAAAEIGAALEVGDAEGAGAARSAPARDEEEE